MNLIKADLRKLLKDKPFKVVLIIMLILNFFTIAILKVMSLVINVIESGEDGVTSSMMTVMGESSFLSLFAVASLGLLIAVCASMFVGKDFGYNTIRNKIICGNSRLKIYLSSLAVNLIIGVSFFLICVIEGSLLSLIFYGVFDNVGEIAAKVLLMLPPYIAIIAVMTFVSMATKSQMLGIVLNVLIVVILPSAMQMIQMANVLALGDNAVINFIISLVPYNIINNLSTAMSMSETPLVLIGLVPALKSIISSVVLAALATFGGYFIFKKADIK